MDFDQLHIHPKTKEQILFLLSKGKLSNTLLYSEKGGYGALATALTTAQYLLCTGEGTKPCNQCHACLKTRQMIHPDLVFSFPFISKGTTTSCNDYIEEWRDFVMRDPYLSLNEWVSNIGGENKQLNINIRETHNIVERLNEEPYEGNIKICIVWLPEYFDKNGNVLLKLLEDSPPNIFFIFVTKRREDILPTLLSRLSLINFNPLPTEELGAYAKQYLNLTDESSINHAKGSIDLLKRIAIKSEVYEKRFSHLIEWFRAIYSKNLDKMVVLTEDIGKWDREDIKSLMLYGIESLQQCFYFNLNLEQLCYYEGEEKNFTQKLSKLLSVEQISATVQQLNTAFFHISRNTNTKILLLDLSLSMTKIFRPDLFSKT